MKSSDKPEISKKWFTNEKPSDVEGKDLIKSLGSVEDLIAQADKRLDVDSIRACLAGLKGLIPTVDKTVKKELDKKKHKDAITVLGKFEGVIQDEVKRFEEALADLGKGEDEKDGEDEDDDKGVFKPEYLARMIKVLRGGKEVQFCFGLNKQEPSQSRLLLCKKREPERLFKMLKQSGEFTSRLLTYGRATGDGKVLQFTLSDDAKEPSQILKLTKEYLKSNRDLKFKKLRVIAGGETFEDDMEEADASTGDGKHRPVADEQGDNKGAPAEQENLRKQFKIARKTWVDVREKAEQALEVVKDGVRNHYLDDIEQFPIAVNKLKELDDIMDNLSHDLRDALDAYVSTPLRQQERLHELGSQARQIVETFADYVEKSPLLTAIDQREFADVEIKAPMSKALRDLGENDRLAISDIVPATQVS